MEKYEIRPIPPGQEIANGKRRWAQIVIDDDEVVDVEEGVEPREIINQRKQADRRNRPDPLSDTVDVRALRNRVKELEGKLDRVLNLPEINQALNSPESGKER